jgi:nitrogen fixation NifU-like protein
VSGAAPGPGRQFGGGELAELYGDMILDHNRRPRNFGPLAGATHSARGDNPLCGDRVTVYLRVEDGGIEEIKFEGTGCAISTASASMMTEALRGKSVAEARRLFAGFHALLTGGGARAGTSGGGVGAGPVAAAAGAVAVAGAAGAGAGAEDGETTEGGIDLGKLEAFGGVREFPMRVKCATLAWHALQAALGSAAEPS